MREEDARNWRGFEFRHVAVLRPQSDRAGRPVEYFPQSRYAPASVSKLNVHGAGPFCRFAIPVQQRRVGVYVITVEDNVVYVGECLDLASRFNTGYGTIQPRNCYERGQSTNCKVNNLVLKEVKSGRYPSLWFTERARDRKLVEAHLLRALRPPWNRTSHRTPALPTLTPARSQSGNMFASRRSPGSDRSPAGREAATGDNRSQADGDFERVWQRIASCAGQPFYLARGQEFTYRLQSNAVVPTTTSYPIYRSQFEKAFERVPLLSTQAVQDLRGPSYVYAVLMADRIRIGEW